MKKYYLLAAIIAISSLILIPQISLAQCTDADGDSYGSGCAAGADCDDTNTFAWDTCATCHDYDGDTRYGLCNRYSGSPRSVTIGTWTGSWSFPFQTSYFVARTQVIYLASEMGGAGQISQVALDVTTIPGQTLNNFTIRMKHTSLSSYPPSSWEDPSSGWTTVFQSNLSRGTTGWRTFTLTTPFAYNGTDNLMVDFSFNNSFSTSNGASRYTTTSVSRSLTYPASSGYGNPLNWSGTSNPPPTSWTYIPNLRITFQSSINGPDCNDMDSAHWSDCGVCIDNDFDGHGMGCDLGSDCDDANPHAWNTCATCHDNDGDTWYGTCDTYNGINGPDCDDANPNTWNTCATCKDNDLDTWYGVCNAYIGINGPDCDDTNIYTWDTCATCHDGDGDSWYGLCNRYSTGSPNSVTIGTGTGSWIFPFLTSNHDARTQVIYLASEIGGFGLISQVALDVTTIPGQTLNNFTIRMKHTSLSSYPPSSWEGPSSGWTTVYQNNEPRGTTGWRTFILTTPFNYNGTDNLMVDFSFNNSSSTNNGASRNTDNPSGRSLTYPTNSGYGDPLNWTGTSNPPPTSWTYIPNLRITFQNSISGPDCNDSNNAHWSDCGICIDNDFDGHGMGCDLGSDCDDANPNAWNTCATCHDNDGDTWYGTCNTYNGINSPDCDDANPNTWNTCATCKDNDGDTWYSGCNAYSSVNGPDCNDANPNTWNTCATCKDNDGDTWYAGCNAYNGISGPDCNDTNAYTWDTCATCKDNDGDTWYGQCNRYTIPTSVTIGTGTGSWTFPLETSYHDARTQVIYLASEIGGAGQITQVALDVTTIPGQTLNYFTIRMKHTSLSSYPPISWEGPSSGWTTVYQNNEPRGSTGWHFFTLSTPFSYNGTDNLMVDFSFNNSSSTGNGASRNTTTSMSRSLTYPTNSGYGDPLNWTGTSNPTPTSWTYIPNLRVTISSTINGPDCNDADNAHWIDCEACIDNDLDGRGVNCAPGPDCDDANPNTWNTCATCQDDDGDTWYKTCDAYNGINGPDCDDANANTWNTCATCKDNDADTWYGLCDTYVGINGPDCNDANANTWNTCATCHDNDGDTWYEACNTYNGIHGPDCNDSSSAHWSDCGLCNDNDGDGHGPNCNLGPDCNDANPVVWTCKVCNDGIDNDADGFTDYPADPTCTSDSDTAELKPIIAGNYNTPGNTSGLFIRGNYAYVCDAGSGFMIVNIANPASPALVSVYDTPGSAEKVVVRGNYAYVTDTTYGLKIFNISNPASPSLVGTYNTPGSSRNIFVTGNYAYIAAEDAGLQIIDISNLSSPSRVGSYNTAGYSRDVFVSGNYAYVADADPGLVIINISNPASPALTATYDTYRAEGVVVRGNYAYVGDRTSGLLIFDISNPAQPMQVGVYDTPGDGRTVQLIGDLAFVADDSGGMQVINVSNPASPVLAGVYDTPGRTWSLFVRGNYAYLADDTYGVQIVNVNGTDSDSDGLPNYWERYYSACMQVNSADATQDYDSDELDNTGEFLNGTNPCVADTDGGGAKDGLEVASGLNPLDPADDGLADTDGDGLLDGWEHFFSCMQANTVDNLLDYDSDGLNNQSEFSHNTNPCNADSDGGGENDGSEVAHSRNPKNAADDDSDNDGLPNFWENSHPCMLVNTPDSTADYDSDGLNNLAEYNNQTDPCDEDTDGDLLSDGDEINIYNTNPRDTDSDNDGLDDYFESITMPCLDPLLMDTDGDQLNDGLEANTYSTDPCDPDTDNDGMNDGWEVSHPCMNALADDADLDPDGDEFSNLWEYTNYTDPCKNNYYGDCAWFVSKTTGSDVTGTGSKNNPWFTIGHAVFQALAGDTICVAAGTYPEDLDIYPENLDYSKRVTLRGGYNPASWYRNIPVFRTKISGGMSVGNGTIEGFVISGQITIGIGSLELRNNILENGGIYSSSEYADFDMTNNLIYNFSYGIYLMAEGQVWWPNCTPCSPYSYVCCPCLSATILLDLDNNTIVNNQVGLYAEYQYEYIPNSCGGCPTYCIGNLGIGAHNNIIYNNNDNLQGHWFGSISYSDIGEIDPLFWNPGQIGYTLQPGSPCINAGSPYSGYNDKDGSRNDMGYTGGPGSAFSDRDHDGMPDTWETYYGLNPDDPADGALDCDSDGVINRLEYFNGTDPGSCVDSDGDGLIDSAENIIYHTNPNDPDTDHDGVNDGLEVTKGTNPLSWDSDHDGLPDKFEIDNVQFDPLNAADGPADLDGDKISNVNEYWNRSRIAISDPGGFGATGDSRSYWGDSGAGDGVVGPEDLSVMRALVAGDFSYMATLKFYNVIPTSGQTMDLDPEGFFTATDLSILRDMIAGRNCGYVGSMPSALELDLSSPPATTIQVGSTTHIGVKVKAQASGKYMTGASVVFKVDTVLSKGQASLFGGDGPAMNHPDYGKYRWDQAGKLNSSATDETPSRIMIRVDAAGTIVINVSTPEVGISGQGRYMPYLELSPVTITGTP